MYSVSHGITGHTRALAFPYCIGYKVHDCRNLQPVIECSSFGLEQLKLVAYITQNLAGHDNVL